METVELVVKIPKDVYEDYWHLGSYELRKIISNGTPIPKGQLKGLRLLVDWMVECDFGYDNIPEEYERYKDEIKDMGYTEGLIYIATMEADKEGAEK